MTSFGSIKIVDSATIIANTKKVADTADSTNWIIFHQPTPESVAYLAHGSGGEAEFAKKLDDSQAMYGVLTYELKGEAVDTRQHATNMNQTKNVFVSFTGSKLPTMARAKAAAVTTDLREYISKNCCAIAGLFSTDSRREVTKQALVQAIQRTRTTADGGQANSSSSGPTSVFADGPPTPEWGDGAYVTLEYTNEGSMHVTYSKKPVAGAMAFIKPGVSVGAFKYIRNGGKSEFARKVGGVFKKNRAVAWTNLFKMADDLKGTIIVRSDCMEDEISLYALNEQKLGNVVKLPMDQHIKISDYLGMACMNCETTKFNVQTMPSSQFANTANSDSEGAAVVFRRTASGSGGSSGGSSAASKGASSGGASSGSGPAGSRKSGVITITNAGEMDRVCGDIAKENNTLDWALFGYDKNGQFATDLSLIGSGKGGLEELKTKLDDSSVMYGIVKVVVGSQEYGEQKGINFASKKTIFISWIGPNVTNNMVKAKASMHKGDLLAAIRKQVAVASELSFEKKADVTIAGIVQSYARVRVADDGKKANQGGGKVESMHAATASPTPNWGDGVYFTQEYADEGSFYTHFSKTPVAGAIAFVKPTVKVAAFKYNRNGGKSLFAKGIGGLNKKAYTTAWCNLFKFAAVDNKGTIIIRSEIAASEMQLWYMNDQMKNNVGQIPYDKEFDFKGIVAIAVVPPGSTLYKGVITTDKGSFLNKANGPRDSAAFSLA